MYILENLYVKQVIISKQPEISEEYKNFVNIVKQKNIKVLVVKAGDKIAIDKHVYIDILHPTDKLIRENPLNNNAIVCKVNYKKFSMLFTGDVEEIAEKEILNRYKDINTLQSTVLKVAHHGSKTSSTQGIIEKINPKIALIGVGAKNTFGHPNNDVMNRISNNGAKIYRTDLNGEIIINVNNKGKLKVKIMYNS